MNVSVWRKRLVFLLLALVIFAVDQATKYPFRSSWLEGQTLSVFPFLSFTYVHNTGSLFGIFQGQAGILGVVSLLISLGIVAYAWRLPRNSGWLPYVTLGFLLGGATGNMLDRLVYGFVVDFFDIQWGGRNVWPVFNVADIAVDVAIGLFVLLAFIEPSPEKAQAAALDDAPVDAIEQPAETPEPPRSV
ncbi:MAG: signal peptidase II [Candidatus Sericytochromatia bacterium]